jgi:hypothetical protein
MHNTGRSGICSLGGVGISWPGTEIPAANYDATCMPNLDDRASAPTQRQSSMPLLSFSILTPIETIAPSTATKARTTLTAGTKIGRAVVSVSVCAFGCGGGRGGIWSVVDFAYDFPTRCLGPYCIVDLFNLSSAVLNLLEFRD